MKYINWSRIQILQPWFFFLATKYELLSYQQLKNTPKSGYNLVINNLAHISKKTIWFLYIEKIKAEDKFLIEVEHNLELDLINKSIL